MGRLLLSHDVAYGNRGHRLSAKFSYGLLLGTNVGRLIGWPKEICPIPTSAPL
jgi:hypothetical protein